jgi:dienelactone hydrolase
MKQLVPFICLVVTLSACTRRIAVVGGQERILLSDSVELYDRPLELRISKPVTPNPGFLVVFATGDGGWHSLDKALFDWISAGNYPVVGFSSKNYLKNLGYVSDDTTTTPRRLMEDFEQIISAAERRLGLAPDTRVILTGMSRGAGLVVVAAGQRELQPNLAGVIAVALTREEEHVVHIRRQRGQPRDGRRPRQLVEIKTYQYLRRLGTVPVAVMQSTHDRYLPAAEARELFGPNTELRRFQAVEAHNHTFSGGRETLCNYLESALQWIESTSQRTFSGAQP